MYSYDGTVGLDSKTAHPCVLSVNILSQHTIIDLHNRSAMV